MTERRGKTPLTLGHLHIPKTAGTSLNAAVAESLGVREVYFHRVGARKSDEATLRLPRSGPARELVLCYPFFSGHMSIGQLQALNRQRIFSILTDPRIRLVKQFTWVAQAGLAGHNSILKWLVATFPTAPDFSSPALHLVQNGPRPHDLLRRKPLLIRDRAPQWIPCRTEHFERLTKDLITIATDSPQEAINYLTERELLADSVVVPHLNARRAPTAETPDIPDHGLPPIEAVVERLNMCTATEYQFLHFLERSRRHYFNLQAVSDDAIASLLLSRGLAR